jgi:hypothetical protein
MNPGPLEQLSIKRFAENQNPRYDRLRDETFQTIRAFFGFPAVRTLVRRRPA